MLRTLGWALVMTGALQSVAQQHAFTQFTPKDGLAQSQVRCITQDTDGYLWFGTLGGASRFDGAAFVNHALQDGLPDAQVSAMAAEEGTVWMGCGSTLVRSTGRIWEQVPLPVQAKGGRILSLVTDGRGRLYAGTDGGGLFVRDSSGVRALEGFPSDTATSVRTLLLLRDGRLLVGLRTGLLVWENGRCRSVRLGDGRAMTVSALAEGKDGSWWIGTFGHGLFRITPDGQQTALDEESGLLQNNVRCLLLDDRGRLWIGTKFGLNLLEDGRLRVFTVHQGLPNDNIWGAFQDREGNLWFGTDGAGVLRYMGDRFVTYTVRDGLCSDLVMNVTADTEGALWLGTYDNGVCRMDGMAMITTFDGLPNNTVWCGLRDRQGALWFGTNDGPVRIERGLVTPLPKELAQALQMRILSMAEAPDGRLWFGTREGLVGVWPDGRVEDLVAAKNGPGRSVRSMVHDDRGRLWTGSDNGITVYDGKSFGSYTTADGLCDNTVQCLLRDAAGRLWAGTTNGLSCYDGQRFRTFRFAADFGSNFIGLLLGDNSGRIWAGTNNGLFLFHPDSLLADPDAREHITLNDGLRSLEFNLNAAFRDRKGKLFFGSAAGLVMHDAERFRTTPSNAPPPIHITGVRSFLQPTDWKGQSDSLSTTGLPLGLRLAYRRNYLTFDYVGISLSQPDLLRYRYRLQGFDQDWLPATDARFASYSNLPHGDYTFEVMCSTDGDTWSAPAAFTFRIDPPFWLRWWFFLAAGLVLVGSAFGISRYRSVLRQRRERTRQLMLRSRMLQLEQQALNANMNRHFVFNALNSIQYHINRQDRATASRYLTSFAKLIRKNLDASQNDTTTLAEELERLELYLLLEHMRFKDKFRYEIHVRPGVDTTQVRLPAMMLQPYVENSIWHGILPMEQQGLVTIDVAPATPGRVLVRIQDDGIGLEQSMRNKEGASGDHISRGIEITKGRADVLRRLELTDIRINGPEQWHEEGSGKVLGTRVDIELPATSPVRNGHGDLLSSTSPLTFDER